MKKIKASRHVERRVCYLAQIVCLSPINCGQYRSKMERNEERRWLVNDSIIQNVSIVLTPCIPYLIRKCFYTFWTQAILILKLNSSLILLMEKLRFNSCLTISLHLTQRWLDNQGSIICKCEWKHCSHCCVVSPPTVASLTTQYYHSIYVSGV